MLTISIILFIMLISSFIYISLLLKKYKSSLKRQAYLKNSLKYRNKSLSEYKKAVDVGTIVSKTDINGIITYVNDSFCKISGFSYSELIGKPHSIVNHPMTNKLVFKDMWGKILNKHIWHGDLENRAKNGTSYFVNSTIVPILDSKENIVEFVSIRYNTTELNNALKEAKASQIAKDDFLANISHELRTPLNAIIGFSQIILKKSIWDEKTKEYVNKVQISGENLLQLVNTILDFSKIEKGEMEFNPQNINLKSDIYDEIIILVELQVKEKNLSISMSGCDGNNYIFADKQLLQQVFINLISNAVKFTPDGGNIDLSYKLEDDKHHFKVCDNGIGIEKDEIENMFKPFKQTTSAKKVRAKGTGLGLSISKNIIENLHHGEISVISQVGVGTCFKIII